jgi:phenylacetate-CoA ligase
MGETRLNRFIYNHSPVFVQNLMSSIYGWQKNRYRYGSPLAKQWLKFYRETAKWSEEQLREYQLKQMRHTIAYAYNHVPFYRERFDSCGVKPEDIETIEDMKQLPYLTKDDIRVDGTRLISDEYDIKDLFAHPTGGSTGMPLMLYNNREAHIKLFAFKWAQLRPGLSLKKDSYANFTGLEIVKPQQKKSPFWRMNYASNQRLYSIFHMSDQNMPYYLEDLAKFRPVWFYGYPSALYTLADFILRSGYDYPHPPQAVITSGEQCLPEFREAIEKAFKTRLWDEYGQGEMAGFAFDCECGKLHEKIEFAVMEFIETGEKADGLEVYELICTSLINDAWPLIRYRVGDLALIDPEAKCPLGRPGRVIEQIYGRTANFLIAGDGSRISNISVMAKKCRNIRALQAVQEEIGQVTLRIVPQPEYDTQADEPFTIMQFRKKLGDESRMKIKVEYVDKIELTKAGKFLSIVSKL